MAVTLISGISFRGKNLIGEKFGRLTVLALSHIYRKNGRSDAIWTCMCSCAQASITEVRSNQLLMGRTLSCGCYKRQRIRETHLKHGHTASAANGGRETRIYASFRGLPSRHGTIMAPRHNSRQKRP